MCNSIIDSFEHKRSSSNWWPRDPRSNTHFSIQTSQILSLSWTFFFTSWFMSWFEHFLLSCSTFWVIFSSFNTTSLVIHLCFLFGNPESKFGTLRFFGNGHRPFDFICCPTTFLQQLNNFKTYPGVVCRKKISQSYTPFFYDIFKLSEIFVKATPPSWKIFI